MPTVNHTEVEHLNPAHKVEIAPQQTETNQKPPWSKLLILVAFATTLGAAVPTGYCIGVINAPAAIMKVWCNQTIHEKYGSSMSVSGLDILWSSIVSIFLVGGAIGSLGGAGLANKFGRKACMFICAALFTIGAVLFIFCRAAKSVEMLILGRLIVGLSSGLVTATLPMYLAEIAPPAQRGTLGVFCGVGVTGGVVVAQVCSLADVFGTVELWHYALSAYMVLIIVCYLPSYVFPESPKYLYVIKSNPSAARTALLRLRGKNAAKLIEQEIAEMEAESNDNSQSSGFCDVLRDPRLLMPLIIVCSFQGGQQLSGINAIFYYSVSIFTKAGFSEINAQWANLGAGCLNLTISLLGPLLMATCRRRTLMMLSSSLCAFFLFCIAFVLYYIESVSWFAWACIVCIMGYIFFYQFGLGPIPYFIGSELFEVAPRSVAMSMGSLASWTCNFIIGMAFPSLQSAWGAFVFLPFSITCVLLFVLTKFYLPETLGRDPSDVAPLVSKGFRSKVK